MAALVFLVKGSAECVINEIDACDAAEVAKQHGTDWKVSADNWHGASRKGLHGTFLAALLCKTPSSSRGQPAISSR